MVKGGFDELAVLSVRDGQPGAVFRRSLKIPAIHQSV